MKREIGPEENSDYKVVSGTTDIVRDIQWVYDNWGDLFTNSITGTREFDHAILEQAPSQGAVTIAEYALRKPDGFIERFASKLIPKDAAEIEDTNEQTEAERIAELDPAFEEMRDFFAPEDTE